MASKAQQGYIKSAFTKNKVGFGKKTAKYKPGSGKGFTAGGPIKGGGSGHEGS